MASVRECFTKDGQRYYLIRCRRGREKSEVSTRWYVPKGWAETSVQKRLQKEISLFESSVSSGETISLKERKEEERRNAEEESKIQTFEQYCEKVYIPSLEITGSKHTISNFKGNLKNHIYPRIGGIKMPDITSAEIKALLLAKQKKLGIASVVKIYTILRLVFKAAFLEGIIEKNPMERVERPSAKKEEVIEESAESYTAEETVYIMECLKNESFQWQCFVQLLIDTGCRRGEACGLKWEDIDFENNSIFFVRQLCYTPEDGVYVDTLKNRKKRKVFIDPDITEMLKMLKKSKTDKKKVVDIQKAKIEEQYVFTQIVSESKTKTVYSKLPIHPDSPTRYFKKFGKKYNVEHFHPHKCRHTQASVALTNGADVVSVSQKLGHSDVSVTLRVYAHASEESQKAASDKFRAALKAAKEPKEKAENK